MATQQPPQKGVAYTVVFPILDADGDLVTAAAGLDSEISKDLGTFADCTNEATEIATSSGMYYLTLTATEMTADTIAIIVKTSTSGAKTTPIVIYTSAQSFDATDTVADAIKAKTDNLPASPAAQANLDVAVSTRSSHSAADVWAVTTRAITDKAGFLISGTKTTLDALNDITAASVWAVATRTLTSFGTLVADIWGKLTSELTTVGSIGKRLADNVDATVSSRADGASYTSARAAKLDNADVATSTRSSHSAADVWSVATRTLTSFGALITDLWHHLLTNITTTGSVGKLVKDNLDATVTSRASATDYTSARATKLDNLDATISSRSTLTSAQAADAVLDEALDETTHNTAGTVGRMLNWVFRRFYNKMDVSSSQAKVYKDDDTTAQATQTLSEAAGVKTRAKAV